MFKFKAENVGIAQATARLSNEEVGEIVKNICGVLMVNWYEVATIRNVARRNNIEIGHVDAELKQTARRNADGSFTTTVDSSIRIEGDITEDQRDMLIKEADNCYVTRLVKGDWVFNDSSSLNVEESQVLNEQLA